MHINNTYLNTFYNSILVFGSCAFINVCMQVQFNIFSLKCIKCACFYFYSNIYLESQKELCIRISKLTPNFSCDLELSELKFNFYALEFLRQERKDESQRRSVSVGRDRKERGTSLIFEGTDNFLGETRNLRGEQG